MTLRDLFTMLPGTCEGSDHDIACLPVPEGGMPGIKLKTDDCKPGEQLHKFRVRAAAEFAVPMEVVAHDAREAELIAENFCEEMRGEHWHALAKHVHKKFEATRAGTEDGAAMLFRADGIAWDTDGEDPSELGLPLEAVIAADSAEEVADALSDKYGWLVRGIGAVTPCKEE